MTPQVIRLAGATLSSLILAAFLKVILLDLGAGLGGEAGFLELLLNALWIAFLYALPLALIAVVATELLRLRRLELHIAIGIALSFIVGWLVTSGEPPMSTAFSGGALSVLALVAIGVLVALGYWGLAGRVAGWRGEAEEHTERLVAEAFQRASAGAVVRPCHKCLAVALGIGLLAFAMASWGLIEVGGLRARLIADTEQHGRAALAKAGFEWATFSVFDGHGVVRGVAPDELERRKALDAVNEALHAVTGLPGVVARIKDEATARTAAESVSQQLAEAARREREARQAIQEARVATEAAREAARVAAEIAKRTADEQAAVEEERIRFQQEARLAEAARQERAQLEEASRLEAARKQEEAQRQEEALRQEEARREEARIEEERQKALQLATVEAAAEPTSAGVQEETVAAIEPAAPAAGDEEGRPAPETVPDVTGAACTSQDLALVESSQVHFEPHAFSLDPASAAELDRVAASIRMCASRPIQVSGYADVNADSLFNPALALQRANAVRDALVARGVAETQIVTKFSPPGLAAVINAPSDSRAYYRRTDFKFLEATALSRDATQRPDERASNCQDDLSKIMSSSIIHFATGSARVSQESIGLIIRLATAIQTCGSVIVTIEGHTDRMGLPARNQRLSEERADSVREALIGAGADPTRLATRGFASSRPFDSNETAEAYALNRRIEFRVSGKFTSTNAGGP